MKEITPFRGHDIGDAFIVGPDREDLRAERPVVSPGLDMQDVVSLPLGRRTTVQHVTDPPAAFLQFPYPRGVVVGMSVRDEHDHLFGRVKRRKLA